MALTAFLLSLTLGVGMSSLAAPAALECHPSSTSDSFIPSSASSIPRTLPLGSPLGCTISGLSGPPPPMTSSFMTPFTPSQPSSGIHELDIETITVTQMGSPVTVTASASTITITDTITISGKPSVSSTTNLPSTSVAPTPAHFASPLPALTGKMTWAIPEKIGDLSSFNITAFPGGQKNIKIVNGIPAKAGLQAKPLNVASSDNKDENQTHPKFSTTWSDSGSALQLLYPANSVNPGQKPQGGAEFYASPLPISTARNVTLRYSVFFPKGFDWVLAGKLPGIYGGHTGCSGGNDALKCFSTRLMWRQNGQGELYLYAAKDKQTQALCSDPRSTCDAAYGFSIGRGSFTWAAGAWTTVQQTVSLNNPGKQDGAFVLDVNGERVIDRADIFYRDLLWSSKATTTKAPASTAKDPESTRQPSPTTTTATTTTEDGGLGGLLGPLLGELGSLIGRRYTEGPTIVLESSTTEITSTPSPTMNTPCLRAVPQVQYTMSSEPTALSVSVSDKDGGDPVLSAESMQRQGTSIGFIGIFFSTFFGGHDDKYATPRDQYVWFKDFAMSLNS